MPDGALEEAPLWVPRWSEASLDDSFDDRVKRFPRSDMTSARGGAAARRCLTDAPPDAERTKAKRTRPVLVYPKPVTVVCVCNRLSPEANQLCRECGAVRCACVRMR